MCHQVLRSLASSLSVCAHSVRPVPQRPTTHTRGMITKLCLLFSKEVCTVYLPVLVHMTSVLVTIS